MTQWATPVLMNSNLFTVSIIITEDTAHTQALQIDLFKGPHHSITQVMVFTQADIVT